MDALMILKAGENQYFEIRMFLTDARGRLHPVHHRHDDIHQDQVGLDLFAKSDGLGTVGCLTDDRDIGYSDQYSGDDFMDMPMIVYHENADGSFCAHA